MIKVVIIIVLETDSGVDWGKALVTGREGQHRLTWVNTWIKIVIIIVLKLDSGVNSMQGSGHWSRGSTYPKKKQNQSNLILTIFFQKSQQVLTHVLSWIDLSFWSSEVESIIYFFLKLRPIQAPINQSSHSWFYN